MAFGSVLKGIVFDAINFIPTDPILPPSPIKPGPEIHSAVIAIVGQDAGLGDGLLGIAPPEIS